MTSIYSSIEGLDVRGHRDNRIVALALIVLVLATCVVFAGLSRVVAAGQSDSSVRGKGLGDAKPIVIEGKADKDVHVTSGWKLFLVGTNRYDNMENNDLHYAVKDVEALKNRFIELGVPQENITILTSESRGILLPEKKNIETAFDKFIASLKKGDCAFVYLSGHGFRFDRDKRAFYAPRNVDVTSKATIIATSVSIDKMIAALQNSAANLKWMTVDACRNDPTKYLDDESTATDKDMKAIGVAKSFIVDSEGLPDTFIFMQGCKDGQCSIESPELEQGLMTYSLLEALRYDDNPADRSEKFELKLVDLLSYVQSRTEELARLCRDRANRPCSQSPAITNFSLENTTFLTNLRREGLTREQWQERKNGEERFLEYLQNSDFERAQGALTTLVDYYQGGTESQQYLALQERLEDAMIKTEEERFSKYLSDNDFDNAQESLKTLASYYPEGTASKQYQSLNKRLADAKLEKEKVDALAQKQKEADEYYEYARKALDSKEYASALGYIDSAIERSDSPKYKSFRNGVLTIAIKGAVEDAIISGNVQKAKNLNKYLAELDAKTAKENESRIAELEQPKAGELKTLTIAGVEVNFHWAPAGTFMMGSPEDEEGRDRDETQHNVQLTQGFWIAETETTQELWLAVMGYNLSEFKDSEQLPVETVSWHDCQDFVQKLNSSHSNALPSGYKYAMPTEAQWEYACRAGTSTPFNFGSVLNGDKANCRGDAPYGTSTTGTNLEKTTPVKSYAPNAWGLFDMHGNVLEWCADWFDSDYYASSSATQDPTGASSGEYRVLRGGSWYYDAKDSRSACRYRSLPDNQINNIGFRLVLVRVDSYQQQTLIASGSKAGELKTLMIAGVDVNFHWAPAGAFMMGSPEDEEDRYSAWEKQCEVMLTQGFWIAETETTQELWQTVMGNNPSRFKGSDQLPVEMVSWEDCQEFIEKLNVSYGSELPSGYKYALPTEAQWEYACRAGTTTPFNFGSTLNGDKANCDGNYPYGTSTKGADKEKTTLVKSYEPNNWGLYDMHGNVEEWCAWFGEHYYDPRVLRGGSWNKRAKSCRSAYAMILSPDLRYDDCGFRIVLVRK
ncbi:MAG: SUMF1/EgtB/PvdO family nonheme iron enzyme [Planctomycetia bacterium]|nr:SUMF1/EgtB/PvdO family nonheme iron enzyme [Planctomycetia bacterium]